MCRLCEEFVSREEFEKLRKTLMQLIEEAMQRQPIQPRFVKTKELCRMLNCSESTLRRYRIKGILNSKKIDSIRYYDVAEVQKLFGNKKI